MVDNRTNFAQLIKIYLDRNGSPMDYSGGRTSDTIISWLEKKTGPPAKAIDSVDAAKAFAEENEVAVIGFFKVRMDLFLLYWRNTRGLSSPPPVGSRIQLEVEGKGKRRGKKGREDERNGRQLKENGKGREGKGEKVREMGSERRE